MYTRKGHTSIVGSSLVLASKDDKAELSMLNSNKKDVTVQRQHLPTGGLASRRRLISTC